MTDNAMKQVRPDSHTNAVLLVAAFEKAVEEAMHKLATPANHFHVEDLRAKLIKALCGPSEGAAPLEYEPQPCCGQYDTCQRVCTPRGIEIGMRKARAESEAGADGGWVKADGYAGVLKHCGARDAIKVEMDGGRWPGVFCYDPKSGQFYAYKLPLPNATPD